VGEFLAWCADHGVAAEHLLGRREWRWWGPAPTSRPGTPVSVM
jgi:hypothetical protein